MIAKNRSTAKVLEWIEVRLLSFRYTTKTQGITLTVNPAGPVGDFTISVSPTSNTVTRGGNATYTVTVFKIGRASGRERVEVSEVAGSLKKKKGFKPKKTLPPQKG